MHPGEPTDAELLADTTAPGRSFTEFYRRHADALTAFCASQGVDAETAADVVAETFMAALESRSRYRETRETARYWLIAIAMNKLADVRRGHEREQRRMDRAQEHAALVSDRDRDLYEALREELTAAAAIDALPEDEREVVTARVMQDRSYAEIARELGVTEATTRKRLSRGLARLRARLERT